MCSIVKFLRLVGLSLRDFYVHKPLGKFVYRTLFIELLLLVPVIWVYTGPLKVTRKITNEDYIHLSVHSGL